MGGVCVCVCMCVTRTRMYLIFIRLINAVLSYAVRT
jgi:hypothetical protein